MLQSEWLNYLVAWSYIRKGLLAVELYETYGLQETCIFHLAT